jgi:hypothetical protein
VIRIEVAVKRVILLDMKQAFIDDDRPYFEKIKALAALEVQDFKALDKLILKQF